MILQYLTAAGAILGLMLAWIGVQAIVRRYHPEMKPGCDVLESMAHHCHGCDDEGCGSGPQGCARPRR